MEVQALFILLTIIMSGTNNQQELVSLWVMRKIETIEEFYMRKFGGIPDDIRKEIGHFNVFK